jgi:hypothetical protein
LTRFFSGRFLPHYLQQAVGRSDQSSFELPFTHESFHSFSGLRELTPDLRLENMFFIVTFNIIFNHQECKITVSYLEECDGKVKRNINVLY